MTSNNLLKFLGNREYLHQVSYQELKSLVIQYPYSLSLRYLLAMKSQQEDNSDLDRNIELLATYGIDRAHLYRIFSEDPIILEDLEESIILGEDFLELKELSTLERSLDEHTFIQDQSNINFLSETIPTSAPNNSNGFIETEDQLPPSESNSYIDKIEESAEEIVQEDIQEIPSESIEIIADSIETSTIIPLPSEGNETNHITNLEEEFVPEIVNSKPKDTAEDFVKIDFETDNQETEIVGKATSGNELAPSESYIIQAIEFDENGLPADAVEISNYYEDKEKSIEESISDLFEEVEQENVAEEAVSDSDVFLEHPEDVLEEESKIALAKNESIEKEVVVVAEQEKIEKANLVTPKLGESSKKIDLPRPQISFEITFSDIDPVSPTKIEEVKPERTPILEQPAFQFDSLNQFEEALNNERIITAKKPIPKSGFSSWREQYSEFNQFSGINLMPLSGTTGRVIKKKKKIVRKKYEKTVAFAEESLRSDKQIASETLAQILVEQGHYPRARAMYKELCLLIPEKSVFFAGEIEKIQNLPDIDS